MQWQKEVQQARQKQAETNLKRRNEERELFRERVQERYKEKSE